MEPLLHCFHPSARMHPSLGCSPWLGILEFCLTRLIIVLTAVVTPKRLESADGNRSDLDYLRNVNTCLMEKTQQLSSPPRGLCHCGFLPCSSPSVCYLNRSFSSSLGCFCSIIYATSFGNSSLRLNCRPRYLRLLVLLPEAVQILCSSFLFRRRVFEHGPKTSFFFFF